MTRSRRLSIALALSALLSGACSSSPLSPEPGNNGSTGSAGSTGGTLSPPSSPMDASPWMPQREQGLAF